MPEAKSDRNKSNKDVTNVVDKEKNTKSRKLNDVKRNKKRSSSTASDSSTSSNSSSSSNTSSGSSSGSSSSSSSNSSNSSSSRSSSASPPKKGAVRTDKKVVKKPEVKKTETKEPRLDHQNKYKDKPKTQKPSDATIEREHKPAKVDKIKHEKEKPDHLKETVVVPPKSSDKPVEKVADKPKPKEEIPKKSNKIHITKLTRNITMAHLKEVFSTWGSVKHVEVPSDRFHPEFNRGFAYIEFDEPTSAQQAIVEMHNGQLDGQEISVVEVPLPRVIEHEKERPRRLSRDRIPDNRRFRSPPRRHVRSPIRQRSPPRRNSVGRRASPFRRRNVRSPPRRRRESPRIRRRTRSPLSQSRRNGKERVGDRKSPVTRRRSKSSTSRSR